MTVHVWHWHVIPMMTLYQPCHKVRLKAAVQPQKMAKGLKISDLERRGIVLSMLRK